ncbi:Bax inhibitor-1/YccA family protein [Streptomyces inhibens]|uniref:Bax inhibitor-1/YccA family protein n=1 Tax=Streptomyces inhibens TaxID=2293571 RepID=UPI001EE6C900|nr:Bax inhibitor-1/YccA family protein [Streptomyces inhibens]UKY49196.1 Bax inhibitor-1/YccA family protein [Streptomyces inhibens]
MATTSNPAIRNLLTLDGAVSPAGTGTSGGTSPAAGRDRPITLDDIVVKTLTVFGVLTTSAFLTVFRQLQFLALPALLIGLGIGIFLAVRPRPSAALALAFAVAQGVVLGEATRFFDGLHPGIGTQAVVGTGCIFAGTLAAYGTRVVRVSAKVTRWAVGTALGLLVLILANLVASWVFGADLGLRDGGILAIVISVAAIAAASFFFLVEFEAANRFLRSGASHRWAWYVAFGLAMTLVWLYLEILRLLSYLRWW